jgi:hypothetical protein
MNLCLDAGYVGKDDEVRNMGMIPFCAAIFSYSDKDFKVPDARSKL